MYYCFIDEDVNGLINNPLVLQKKYAERLGNLCIANLKTQRIVNSFGETIQLKGEQVFLRCTNDNLLEGIRLLSKCGANLVEEEGNVAQIENWSKLGLTRRKIYECYIIELINNPPKEVLPFEKIFIKSKDKGFSANLCVDRLANPDPYLVDFLKSKGNIYGQRILFTKGLELKKDSLGTRESRHVVLNNRVINSSRQVHSLKHTVPKSHKLKALDIVNEVKSLQAFPSNYILDIGEFVDDGDLYLDIVEINPITCSMCFVNNSIFDVVIPEIEDIRETLQIGPEFCLDALTNPSKYDMIRVSNKNYCYNTEEHYNL